MTRTGTAHVTPVGGNVFADLGFPPEEAAALKAASLAIIRARLATTSGVAEPADDPASGGDSEVPASGR